MVREFGAEPGVEDYHDFLVEHGWAGYERSHGIGNNDVHPATVPFPAELHEEAWVAERANHWLSKNGSRDKPWLMWASFTKPHPPFDPPAPYNAIIDPRDITSPMCLLDEAGTDIADYMMVGRDPELRGRRYGFGWHLLAPEAIQNIRMHYMGLMAFQAAMINRILDQLEEIGELDNTMVVYTADHGDLLGDFSRFFKTNLMDAASRVPLIIKPPVSVSCEVGSRDHLVSLVDLFPTFCDVAGISTPDDLDGQSLVNEIHSISTKSRELVVTQTSNSHGQKYMLRTEHWKYCYHEIGATEELYDVKGDYELINLASDSVYAEVIKDFRGRLIQWCRDKGDDQMLDSETKTGLAESPINDMILKPEINTARYGWRHY